MRKTNMSQATFEQRIKALDLHHPASLLKDSRIGIEKESLRVTAAGEISQRNHPLALGAALTHPNITTDYSEALLELITPPHQRITDVLAELDDLHRWVYANLGDELLWPTSMPCLIKGENSVRIAEYGSSNAGMMKHIYRRGLGHRYGKLMQVISGVHFNYSLPDPFWSAYRDTEGSKASLVQFRSEGYMAMLRNLQRIGWMVPYLFGASPAVCESFLDGQPTTLEYFGQRTYYEPYATSLRLGDIGYQNKQEGRTGVKINYNHLNSYLASLENATETPCPEYGKIGVVVDGSYRQLNHHQLQIENEYYSSARPKAIAGSLQKPVRALEEKGIEYIELRSVDVNAYDPHGISACQMHFLEAFMIYALLSPSPSFSSEEFKMIDDNLSLVAHCGRDPQLSLSHPDGKTKLRDWADKILTEMQPICDWLDQNETDAPYRQALLKQCTKVIDPTLIPSTRMIETMAENKESFFEFSMRAAQNTAQYFQQRPLGSEKQSAFSALAKTSLATARQAEKTDSVPFDQFLEEYFAQ